MLSFANVTYSRLGDESRTTTAGGQTQGCTPAYRQWTVEIVKRSDVAKGFVVLPRRWVVERSLAWLNRNRRLAKDFEQTIASATAWLFIASIQLFARRIARLCSPVE